MKVYKNVQKCQGKFLKKAMSACGQHSSNPMISSDKGIMVLKKEHFLQCFSLGIKFNLNIFSTVHFYTSTVISLRL